MKVSTIILAILLLVFIGQTVYFYPQLPETIASHFDAGGQANGFMSKFGFIVFEVILLSILLAIFLSAAKLLTKMPDSMINLPNKDFWLAPERRERTLAVFGDFFAWLSVALTAMFIAVNYLVLNANLMEKDPNPRQFWIVLGLFFASVAVLIFVYLRRFLGAKTA